MTAVRTKTRGIVIYLLISFVGAWLLEIIGWRVLHASATDLAFQFVLLPAAFMPAIATIIVRKWVTHEGFTDAGLRPHLRRTWPYYLFAAILPLFVVGVIVVLALVLGASQPDFSLHRALRVLVPGVQVSFGPFSSGAVLLIIVFQSLLVGIPFVTFISWGEEFGWRSYLQIRLLSHRPLLAALATGLIWGIWHYPLILMGYERFENVFVGLVTFPMNTILLAIIFGWLRRKTGSIWSASMAHAATNDLGALLINNLFLGGPHFLLVSYVGVLAWIPLGAVCAWIILTGQLTSATDVRGTRAGIFST